jgi:hypothetical protein
VWGGGGEGGREGGIDLCDVDLEAVPRCVVCRDKIRRFQAAAQCRHMQVLAATSSKQRLLRLLQFSL